MKDSTKHLTFVQAALVSLALVGCSKVNSSTRPSSNRAPRRTVEAHAAQRIQGCVLQASDVLDIKYGYESQLNERMTIRPQGLNATSQEHNTVSVGDALKDDNIAEEPNAPSLRDALKKAVADSNTRENSKAVEDGYSGSMVELGWACYGTEDFEKAFKCFHKAADQGESEAMVSLGWLYAKGQGIPRDEREAVRLWRKAADRGHAIAMLSLGAAYANGEGVNQDYRQAFTWYSKGANAGDAMCMFGLGLLHSTGRGVARDPAKALDWWRKGAEKQHAGCMANLGWAYLYGKGAQKDRNQAVHWLQKAADLGNECAKKRLVEIGEIR